MDRLGDKPIMRGLHKLLNLRRPRNQRKHDRMDRADGVPTVPKPNDLSRSPVALDENTAPDAVIEMSLASWLLAGRVPGVNRSPLRKLDPHPNALLARLALST